MSKTILITGSTDGLGLEAAKRLAGQGHQLILHGRNPNKLQTAQQEVAQLIGGDAPDGHAVDLSDLAEVKAWSGRLVDQYPHLDVVINNAGVFQTDHPKTSGGLDIRFAVNTIAPYVLARDLMSVVGTEGRIVNLSSAAQAPVDLDAIGSFTGLDHMPAYAQSKLALTMWSMHLGLANSGTGPVVVAVNPGSLLATKMVRQGFGVAGSDIGIGVDITSRAAVGEDFAEASGRYFDNDARSFGPPHPDAEDPTKRQAVVETIETVLAAI